MQQRGQRQSEKYLKVEGHFRNGTSTHFLARAFNIDVKNIGSSKNQIQLAHPHPFTYKGASGEDFTIYLTLNEVAGIVVTDEYR